MKQLTPKPLFSNHTLKNTKSNNSDSGMKAIKFQFNTGYAELYYIQVTTDYMEWHTFKFKYKEKSRWCNG